MSETIHCSSLMAKAAIAFLASALFSLAVIRFIGSGGLKSDKDLRAGVALFSRAAFLSHVVALRVLGLCLQDGFGKENWSRFVDSWLSGRVLFIVGGGGGADFDGGFSDF